MSSIRETVGRRRIEPQDLLARGLSARVLADVLDQAPDPVGIIERTDSTGGYVFLYCNREFERFYGATREHVLGKETTRFFATRAAAEDIERVHSSLTAGKPFRYLRTFEERGERISVEVSFRPLGSAKTERWVFMTRDLTALRKEQLRMQQLSAAIEQGNEPVTISDADGGVWRFGYVNEAFVRATGYRQEELLGNTWDLFLCASDDRAYVDGIRAELDSGQHIRTELPFRHKDGRLGVFEANLKPLLDPTTKLYSSVVGVFRDVTEIKHQEEALRFDAEHDPLTGLHNRRYFERTTKLAIEVTGSTPCHLLLFIDLDGFKKINDEFGHDAGDAVLVAAAQAFHSCVFQSDVFARWGGDEFAAVLFHCELHSGLHVAQSMLKALSRIPHRRGVTASIGMIPIRSTDTVIDLIQRADRACYAAKSSGRNRVVVGE